MRRIISLIIALCLILGSFSFAFAEAWTNIQASNVTLDVHNIYQYLRDFLLSYNSGQNSNWTFGDLYWEIHRIGSWIAPITMNDGSYDTLWEVLMNIAIDTRSYLPSIPDIAVYVANWMSSNNAHLLGMRNALTRMSSYQSFVPWENAHTWLVSQDTNNSSVWNFITRRVGANGGYSIQNIPWTEGSPLGNIALMLGILNENLVYSYSNRWVADLKHYNDNLTTWDSQGNTLQQVAFTPESAIQGLYRYLAFTQRDVARLTYVLASDEEIEAREKARANQTEVFDNFIDPNGSGSASVNDFADVSSASGNVKQNFSTGYSSSSIWDIFNQDHYGWFSQECADALDTTNASSNMRKSNNGDYPTPLLDAYYEEILSLGGLKDD